MNYRLIFTIIIILLLEFLTPRIAKAKDYLYLFSWDAKFIKIDIESDKIVDLGNLWWEKILDVGPVYTDPERKLIFINSSKAFLQGLSKPPSHGVMIFSIGHKGNLTFEKRLNIGIEKVDAAGITGPPISGLGFSPDGRKMYVSWSDEKEGITGIFDTSTYSKIFEISKNWAGAENCFTADNKKLIIPWGKEFLIYNTDKYNIVERFNYYDKVGDEKFFSKTVTSIGNCKAVIVEYKEMPKDDKVFGRIYIYDLEKEKVISQLGINFQGEYKLAKNGEQLLIDETKNITVAVGKAITSQPKKVGRLHIYDVHSGKEIRMLTLPEGSGKYWISPDDKKLYYFKNQLLIIVDFEKIKVLKTFEIPFENAYAVFINEGK